MNAIQCLNYVIEPAIDLLGGMKYANESAYVQLVAIGLQESRLEHRRQIVGPQKFGPARGFWQFEVPGVSGVLTHPSSKDDAKVFLQTLVYSPYNAASTVHLLLENNDLLAAGFARLLLWTLPEKLPKLGDVDGAWAQYIKAWRPGKPHRKTWDQCYKTAMDAWFAGSTR